MHRHVHAARLPGVAALLLLLASAAAAQQAVSLRAGFNGYLKEEHWFPVTIEAGPGAVGFELAVARRDWSSAKWRRVFQVEGRFKDGAEKHTTLCKIDGRDSNQALQCTVRYADGTTRETSVQAKVLSSQSMLVLVISANPHAMGFLASVGAGNRSTVSVVPVTPDTFPVRWQALDSVDLIILDSPGTNYSPTQRAVLRQWVAGGGTALVTANGLEQPDSEGAWELLSDAAHTLPAVQQPAGALAPLLGKYGDYLRTVPLVALHTPPENALLAAGEDTLLAAWDIGAGRVVALGFDWREMTLRDRIFFDGARQQLWSHILALSRPAVFARADTDSVTPAEARAGFLAKYIALFLLAYVGILGPANWLVLRAMQKLEYSIVTIPAGAVLFSAAAVCLGLSLRSNHTILRETEVLYGYHSNHALVLGTAGILAPNRAPYDIHLADGLGMLDFEGRHSRFGESGYRQKELPVYASEPTSRIRNVRIGTWSIRYFNTSKIADLGGTIDADLALSEDGVTGKIHSRLDVPLRDAYILHRWNRAALGTLAPGSTTDVALPLKPASREVFPRCKDCGGFHGSDASYEERYCRKHPLPEPLRSLVSKLNLHEAYGRTVLVGWQDLQDPYLTPEREVVDARRQRLCVFPLDRPASGDDIVVAEGFVKGIQAGNRSLSFLSDIRAETLPHGTGSRSLPYSISADGECFSWTPPNQTDNPQWHRLIRQYDLGIRSDDVRTTSLTVHWDAGETDPDEGPLEGVLKALDWQATNWVELASAAQGEHTVVLPTPDRFVRLPRGDVRLVVVPADTNQPERSCSVNFLEIEYRGRRQAL